MRVVLALELGRALGHASRLVRLAGDLEVRGHDVSFAAVESAPLPPAEFLGRRAVVRVPGPHRFLKIPDGGVSYAEVLLGSGWDSVATLAPYLEGWRRALVGADEVWTDHAPTAALAALDLGLGTVLYGDGFTVPTRDFLQPYLGDGPSPEIRLRRSERRIGETVAGCVGPGFGRTPHCVADVFAEARRVLAVRPDLDPFGPRAGEVYEPQRPGVPGLPRAAWNGTVGRRVLAYLQPDHPSYEIAMRCAEASSDEWIVVNSGSATPTPGIDGADRVRVATAPIDLEPLLADCDLAIGYGGIGFLGQCVAAGVPSVVVPMTREQLINGRCAERIGMATVCTDEDSLVENLTRYRPSNRHRV